MNQVWGQVSDQGGKGAMLRLLDVAGLVWLCLHLL